MSGYEIDNWSDNVVPEDMLGVAEGDEQKLVDFAEGKLTVTDHKNQEEAAAGAGYLMVDNSDSMVWTHRAKLERFDRARMVELALAKVFNDQGRELVTVDWASQATRNSRYLSGYEAKVRVYEYGYDDSALEDHIRAQMGGGTNFLPALEKTVELAQEAGNNADIIVMTDGEVISESSSQYDLDQFVDQAKAILHPFRQAGGKLWVLAFGDASQFTLDLMNRVADGAVVEKKLADSDNAGQMIRDMVSSREQGPRRVH